jgi:hypothetical protein
MRVDTYKVIHWMNVRKMTSGQVADAGGIEHRRLTALLSTGGDANWPDEMATAVVRALEIDAEKLSAGGQPDLTVLTKTARELRNTRRAIQRDEIHFYNYYSMAAPPGVVAPVILDILCPKDRIPALNNGHLEPAITVNLGPGDIHGRWGRDLDDSTWLVMKANHDDDQWLAGDSYVEPSYCPHSYSLASDVPARIVSYTGHSNLAALVEDVNNWPEPAARTLLGQLDDGLTPHAIAGLLLSRRGHGIPSAADAAGLSVGELNAALDNGDGDVLRQLGDALGIDYRLLLSPEHHYDAVGKTYKSIADCRREARPFQGYEVASLASASHLSDLTGLYMRVTGDAGEHLCEPAETHYLVIGGDVQLSWMGADGQPRRTELGVDGTAWAAPFVPHRWSGHGALIKLGSGRHLSYLDLFELTNTYAAASTVRRAYRDVSGWGYDPGQ